MSNSQYPDDPAREQQPGAPTPAVPPAADGPGQTTSFNPGQTTNFDPGQTSAYGQGQTSAYGQGQAPAFDPGQTSTYGQGQTYGQDQTTAFDPGQTSTFDPGRTGFVDPGALPTGYVQQPGYGSGAFPSGAYPPPGQPAPGEYGATATYQGAPSGYPAPPQPGYGPPPGPYQDYGQVPVPPPGPARKSQKGLLIGLAAVLVVLLVAGGLTFYFWPSDDGPTKVTACDQAPTFATEQLTTESNGLVARMNVTSQCDSGDVVGGPDTRVTILDSDAVLASGAFDFTGEPIVVQGGKSATVELTFPKEAFFATPGTLGQTSGGANLSVDMDRGQGGVTEVTLDDPAAAQSQVQGGQATEMVLPPGRDPNQVYAEALRRQVDYDRDFVRQNLNNQWVAQLSTKWEGVEWNGKRWSNKDIMDEFLELRMRFTDVRMLEADEWPVFSNSRPMFVTVATETFSGYPAANAWCDRERFPTDECFAKFISSTRGPSGTTEYRR